MFHSIAKVQDTRSAYYRGGIGRDQKLLSLGMAIAVPLIAGAILNAAWFAPQSPARTTSSSITAISLPMNVASPTPAPPPPPSTAPSDAQPAAARPMPTPPTPLRSSTPAAQTTTSQPSAPTQTPAAATAPSSRPATQAAPTAQNTPRPSAPSTPQQVDAPIRDPYAEQVAAWVERHKGHNPDLAARQFFGVVMVQFTLDRQGRLRRARLDQSSGHRQLDDFALAQLQQMAPFPRSPAGEKWSTRQFNISMRYSPKRS